MVANPRAAPRFGALRPLNQPAPVQTKVDAQGIPTAVLIDRHWRSVLEIGDAWRIDDEWWRAQPVSRLYYRVDLAGLGGAVLYIDLKTSMWFRQQA